MEKVEKNEKKEEIQINILEVLKDLLHKWWIILIAGAVCAGILFCYTYFTTEQTYTASIKLYVNNSSIDKAASAISSITSGDLTASRSLTDTYTVILKTRDTIDQVNDLLEDCPSLIWGNEAGKKTSKSYTYDELVEMISADSVDSTEVMKVTVTCNNGEDAVLIANAICTVLPERTQNIVIGSSMKIVEYASVYEGVSRGFTKRALIGFAVGVVLAIVVIFIMDFYMNDTIRSVDDVKQILPSDIPVLAVVPDTIEVSSHKYAYRRYDNYGYYQYHSEPEKSGKGEKK